MKTERDLRDVAQTAFNVRAGVAGRPQDSDADVTRLSFRHVPRVLMYGRWWDLEPDSYYRVRYNRELPGKSTLEKVTA